MAVKIAPSLLSADFARLADEISSVEAAGADWIHVDVMDGRFVPNLTIGPPVVKSIQKAATKPLDVHLMVESPESLLQEFADAGADYLTVHAEACVHLHRVLGRIKELGCKPGVALNPATSLHDIEYVLDMVDLVLIMSVNPGFGGQEFIESSVAKIRTLKEWIRARRLNVDIEVDGGINKMTAGAVADAGATVLVAGTAVFGEPDYQEAIETLRSRAADKA